MSVIYNELLCVLIRQESFVAVIISSFNSVLGGQVFLRRLLCGEQSWQLVLLGPEPDQPVGVPVPYPS